MIDKPQLVKKEYLVVKKNGVYNVCSKILNEFKLNSNYKIIFNNFFEEDYIDIENEDSEEWLFNSENIHEFLWAASYLENSFEKGEYKKSVLSIYESINEQNFLYRILFDKENTKFLNQEDSINIESEIPYLKLKNIIYMDSNFIKNLKNEDYKNIVEISMTDFLKQEEIEKMDDMKLLENLYFESIFEKYKIKNIEELIELNAEFINKLYNNSENISLIEIKNKFVSIIENFYNNENNQDIINNIEKYFELFKELEILNITSHVIQLPLVDEFILSLNKKNGYITLKFDLEEQTIVYEENNNNHLQTEVIFNINKKKEIKKLKKILTKILN